MGYFGGCHLTVLYEGRSGPYQNSMLGLAFDIRRARNLRSFAVGIEFQQSHISFNWHHLTP